MSELQRLLSDPRLRPTDKQRREPVPAPDANLGNILRVVSSLNEQAEPPSHRSSPQDWDALIHRVQAAARQSREVEARAREREDRIEAVLQQVREDVHASNERVRVAEAQAREAQIRAEALIMVADERAKTAEARVRVAEERAQHAEEWLVRVQDAITAEFADLTEPVAA